MRDMASFIRPIAHRGLHDPDGGLEENTAGAFQAALAAGVGIECDVRPARGGLPVVFHDATLDRMTHATGPLRDLSPAALAQVRTRRTGEPLPALDEVLHLVSGRVPLLIEVKSEWEPPDTDFLRQIAAACLDYDGPVALMSFDPDVMTVLRELAPQVPRGIVSGSYRDADGSRWWGEDVTAERAERLCHLLESGPAAPDFYAYDVSALPTPVTRFVREVCRNPLFTWTVRTQSDRQTARLWADAPIFEGDVKLLRLEAGTSIG